MSFIRWFETISQHDVPLVGGKNASLGEMITTLKKKGIRVPDGFATTAQAYWDFLDSNQLKEEISSILKALKQKKLPLKVAGRSIRQKITHAEFSSEFAKEIEEAYLTLGKRYKKKNIHVAVRSSATAEDLPDASFAGQQETFLNVSGLKELLEAVRKCFASLFTDRAIIYREAKGFNHLEIALSVGIQKMVQAEGSGVMFTLDPETGFRNVVVINAGWGLGENVVQGTIIPDEYLVFKPLIGKHSFSPIIEKTMGEKEKKLVYTRVKHQPVKNINTSSKERKSFVLKDSEILELAASAISIEKHYQKAMDIEWAKEQGTKELFILQARPETVHSSKVEDVFKTYSLKQKGKVLCEGLAIGEAIAVGKAQVIKSVHEIDRFEPGSILVTTMTSPDWVPIMQKAAGIITDLGGRTSHAAIVSRELGIPAIVGTNNATKVLKNHRPITLSCVEGDRGYVYDGILKFEENKVALKDLPEVRTQIMMNIGSPVGAFRWWRLPAKGIGLARMEFIIDNFIKIHPLALVHPHKVKDPKERKLIETLTARYKNKKEYFIDLLAQGIGRIAASRYPDPVIVRMSDFKTNEYANLIGGQAFEPKEENPMLGFRGACRYYSERYREGFALECAGIKKVREQMGLTNVIIMIPFCRTLEEADKVLKELERNGLKRHQKGLEVYVMAEIPSNVILAEQFAERFDGFSIGSNDLTQLVLGVDRDSTELASLFDERNQAVKSMIQTLIQVANRKHCKVGICGQAPSDHPQFAEFLIEAGIDSISLNPDSIVPVIQRLGNIHHQKPKAA